MTDKPCPNAETNKHWLHTGARPPHPCPYKQDINDDDKTLCECCEVCIRECAMDI